ncbi:STAS domain-containing protein [Micromonospora sp. NPDC000316]|uniref:STAS domain-containing protein n=1 Tax=Micromonospora sp. NPDC000316 TaxID=3364216 RepID=UPI00369600F0
MSDQLLTIDVTRLDGGHIRLRLSGELDFDTAPELVSAVAELPGDGHQQLTIDLTGVSLCDSSGLSALLVAHRAGGSTRLIGVSAQVQRMLDRTGLTELLAVQSVADGADLRAIG